MSAEKLSKSILAQKIQLLVIVLLFSYDFFTYVTTEENSVLIRLISYAVLMGLYGAYLYYYRMGYVEREKNRDTQTVLIFLFFVFYLIRLVVDLFFKNVYQEIFTHNYTAVFLFLNSVLLPCFIINIFDLKRENAIKMQTYCGIIALVCLFSAIINFLRNPADFIEGGGRVGAGNLDTISLGHLGVTVAILGLYWYERYKKTIFFLPVIVFGVAVAFFAGSRGPIVALAGCFFFFFLVKKNWKVLLLILVVSVVLMAFYEKINGYLIETWDVYSLQRFYDTLFEMGDADQITSGRDNLYKAAWQYILDYPVFGYSFVTEGTYVHNFVLEAFMATGIIGGLIFCIVNIRTIIRAFHLLREYKDVLFIVLVYIQYFLYAMFSRSMLSLPVFWLMLFLVNRLYVNYKIR